MTKIRKRLGFATREEIQKAREVIGNSSDLDVLLERARLRQVEMTQQLSMYEKKSNLISAKASE